MLNYNNTKIEKVSVHSVGNKTNGEDIRLSKSQLDISDGRLRELLLKFFTTPFTSPEFYSFTSASDDFTQNPLYNIIIDLLDNKGSFHQNSITIAKYLYELSEHPQIKSGDVFVAYFTDVIVEDEMVNAIGIFKSENKLPFLKVDSSTDEFSLLYEDGISIEKLDKGCLILDTERTLGLRICTVDNSNKSAEAQYWKDQFLQLKPFNDDFYFTKQLMNVTKDFVVNEMPGEFETSRLEQIDMLNRSSEYFKTHNNFNKREFENEILRDEDKIRSFRNYNDRYANENEINFSDTFEISPGAVKKQNRIFKSVLKLDKNFHVYIHGDSDLIQPGVERDGRKYYKIYYDREE